MVEYTFLSADSLQSALEQLTDRANTKVIAGGTDLMVEMNNDSERLPEFDYLLDISNLEELRFIEEKKDRIEMGALTTHSQLIVNSAVNNNFPFLVEAARSIGSTQIRNRGTVGGNISNASPAADLIPPLIALETRIELQTVETSRVLPLEDLIIGPYRTDIEDNELMTKLIIPRTGNNYYGNFQKIGRRKALNIARINLALLVGIEDNSLVDVRVVPGSATPSQQRFSGVEAQLRGKRIDEVDPAAAGTRAAEEMVSITGERWSTPYKKPALANLMRRGLEKLIEGVKADAGN